MRAFALSRQKLLIALGSVGKINELRIIWPRPRTKLLPAQLNSMPDLDQVLGALFLVALLLYLYSGSLWAGCSTEWRPWIRRGAILTLGIALAIAIVASSIWFAR
jgi:hypothetical protein